MTRAAAFAALFLFTAPAPEESAAMHRIDHATRLEDANGAGRDGFTEGDPNTQTPATVLTAKWANSVQEELARAVEAMGVTLDPNNNAQLAGVLAELGGDIFTTEHTWSARQRFESGYIANHFGVGGEVLYVENTDGVPTTRAREVYLPLTAFRPESGSPWALAPNGLPVDDSTVFDTLTSPGASVLRGEFRIPSDCRITRVRVPVNGNGTAQPMRLLAGRKRFGSDVLQPNASKFHRLAATASLPAVNGLYLAGTLDLVGDLAFANSDTLAIWITSGAANQTVYWVGLTVQDAGPRSW